LTLQNKIISYSMCISPILLKKVLMYAKAK